MLVELHRYRKRWGPHGAPSNKLASRFTPLNQPNSFHQVSYKQTYPLVDWHSYGSHRPFIIFIHDLPDLPVQRVIFHGTVGLPEGSTLGISGMGLAPCFPECWGHAKQNLRRWGWGCSITSPKTNQGIIGVNQKIKGIRGSCSILVYPASSMCVRLPIGFTVHTGSSIILGVGSQKPWLACASFYCH